MTPAWATVRAAVSRWPEHQKLLLAAGALAAVGALVWLAGFLVLGSPWRGGWNALWGLAGVSFLGAVILPVPTTTLVVLVSLRDNIPLGIAGVVGTAVGGTVGAALLLGLGEVGRRVLERRAKHSRWSRRVLDWSERLVSRWTYLAVGVLLLPFFIPRAAVLYPAVALRLHPVPFLVVVFLGTLVRNVAYFAAIVAGADWVGL